MLNRREMLLRAGAAAVGLGFGGFPLGWAAQKGNAKRVLFFTKSAGFEHSVIKRDGDKLSFAEQILTDLGKKHGFEVTATKDGGVFSSDELASYDAFVFYTTGDLTTEGTDGQPPMTPQGKEALLQAVHDGKGFVGIHCASDTFHSEGDRKIVQAIEKRDPYIRMLGGEFITHGKQQEARLSVVDPSFPGAEGLGETVRLLEEWYALK
ncbi:MAG: ThuA domain-containing protein, partial [Pirellulales bacterium]